MIGPLLRLSMSYCRRTPGHTALAVIGVAIGVATYVSVAHARQNLDAAFTALVVRLAGRADLQISGPSGVPEIMETLRPLPEIEAVLPVVEQVAQPVDARLGGLLVLGVDLVGDQKIRDYGLNESDIDVDDPLVFLAQPDSIAISREFADRAGFTQGSTFALRVADTTTRSLNVRAILPSQELTKAYGGNIAVMDVYAAQMLFGRGDWFDRLEVRLKPGTTAEQGAAAVSRVIGPSYAVAAPARRGAEIQRTAEAALRGFEVMATLALAVGAFLVFTVFATSVARRWRDIGVLRAIGATPSQVLQMFLVEAVVIGSAGSIVGVVLGGLVAERSFGFVDAVLAATGGARVVANPTFTLALWWQGLAVGVVASVVGAWVPARRAASLRPVDAVAVGVERAGMREQSWLPIAAGALAVIAAWGIMRFPLVPPVYKPPLATIAGGLAATLLAGRASRPLLVPVSRWLPTAAGAIGRIASDALREPGRTLGTSATLTICAAFVLGTSGFLQSVSRSFDGWLANIMTADLVVRAAPGWGPSQSKLPLPPIATILQRDADVRAFDAQRDEKVVVNGRSVTLTVVEADAWAARLNRTRLAERRAGLVTELRGGHACLVSRALSEQTGLHEGDTLTIQSPSGPVAMRVADVATGDRSAVTIDRSLFLERWNDERVDTVNVTLVPGANAEAVRQRLRLAIAPYVPALVVTREEFVEEVQKSLSLVYLTIRSTTACVVVAALMAIGLIQLVHAHERRRDIGVLRAIGAVPAQIAGAMALESTALTVTSLVVATPLGLYLSWLLRGNIAGAIAGYRFDRSFPLTAWLLLAVGLPFLVVIASWMPARVSSSRRPVETMTND